MCRWFLWDNIQYLFDGRLGKEYARADHRWGTADPTVVSLEILTVLGAGPMACYILYQIVNKDPARHYWIIVLSTAELYGGWMTFCPEWLTGSPSLNTSNPLYLYVYLIVSHDSFSTNYMNDSHSLSQSSWISCKSLHFLPQNVSNADSPQLGCHSPLAHVWLVQSHR